MNEDQIMREMFGQRKGQIPKVVKEQIGFAVDAMNAHQRGMSIPQVALNYRYEPGQAEIMLKTCVEDYGAESVRRLIPRHIASLIDIPKQP